MVQAPDLSASASTAADPGPVRPRQSRRHRLRSGRPTLPVLIAFLAPGLLLYGAVVLYPVISALSYAFFEWNGLVRIGFVGLQNFVTVLTLHPFAGQFRRAVINNGVFFVGTLLLQGTGGMLLALSMIKIDRLRRLAQTVISLPYLMSSLVIGYIWTLILSPQWGPVNAALRAIGLDEWALPWLGEPRLLMPILILINNWQWIGAGMLIFGAALAGVPDELIEAATMDGAGFWRRFWHVQLPHLVAAIEVYVVLLFIGAINVFDLVYAIGGGSSGGPGGAADVLGTLFYRVAFTQGLNSLGLAGALSVMILVLTLICTFLLRGSFGVLSRRMQ